MGGCPIPYGKLISIAKKRAGKEKIGASARRIEGMTQTCIPRRRYTRQPSVRNQRNFGRLLIVLFALWAVVTVAAAIVFLG